MTLFFCGEGPQFVQTFVYSTNYLAKCKELWGFQGSWAVKNLPTMQEMQQEPQVWSLDQEDPLEKETATHSNFLAWRFPWTEEEEETIVHSILKSQIWLKWLDTHTHTHTHTHTESLCQVAGLMFPDTLHFRSSLFKSWLSHVKSVLKLSY